MQIQVSYDFENRFNVKTKEHVKPNEKGELSLASPNDKIEAVFSLHEGGRLKSLYYENRPVIQDLKNTSYQENYASAVLFPFVNRINNGNYSFHGKKYQLKCNEKGRNNAIHGLIFDKHFQLADSQSLNEENSIVLRYTEDELQEGFPFLYSIDLVYTLKNSGIELSIKAENRSSESFPFTMGWHPYFVVKNENDCVLEFDSLKQVLFNQDLITIGMAKSIAPKPFPLKNPFLDDCFVLNDKKVRFKTPTYHIQFNSSNHSKYLQLYKPQGEERIAIEPMMGISDSFNNKKGVKILQPNETFTEKWNLEFLN